MTQRDGVTYLSLMFFSQWWKFIIDLRYSRKHSALHTCTQINLKGYILHLYTNHAYCTHLSIHKEKGSSTKICKVKLILRRNKITIINSLRLSLFFNQMNITGKNNSQYLPFLEYTCQATWKKCIQCKVLLHGESS